MAVLKCKMCGGDLNIIEGASTAECEFCGSIQTIPKVDDEKKLTLFARANRLRAACEFDKAAGIYESIVADFPEEAEAYWGLVLCKYGIEYVDDPATGKKIPTCHRSSFDSIMDDGDFEQVLENADFTARCVYREEAKQIEEIRKGIIAVSANEEPYDIFICYKETDENGDRTLDSVLAQDVYDALTDKGYRVFFSRITLEDRLGVEYEPYIFAALNSAKIMLAFGTDYEYFNAVWVKNEWSRFLKLMAKDKSKHLIPCFKGIDAYDMPKEFARLQAQDLGRIGAVQDLLRGVEKLLPRQNANSVVIQEKVVVQTAPQQISQLENLLKRGELALEDENWDAAKEFFNQALNIDAECGSAYFGLEMATKKCSTPEKMGSTYPFYYKNYQYSEVSKTLQRARQFADESVNAKLAVFDAALKACVAEQEEHRKQQENQRLLEEENRKWQEEEKRQRFIEASAEWHRKNDAVQSMICASYEHALALKVDGSVLATGNNYHGECDVSNWRDIVAVSADVRNTVGLKSNGTVVAVGYNQDGQCNVSGWQDIVAISTGGWGTTVGLRSNGTVVAVGYNEDGQCNVSEWQDIVAICADCHTVGLKSDGTVVATGENDSGECNVSNWRNIVAISTGCSHTVGLKSDGTVVAVGYNKDGRRNVSSWRDIVAIGSKDWGTVGLRSDGTVVVVGDADWCDVSNWTDIVAISVGDHNVAGLKYDGSVAVAYDNKYGRCDASDWTDIVAISSGERHILGLKSDGTTVAVGESMSDGPFDISKWKLFESIDSLENERLEAAEKRRQADEWRKQQSVWRASGLCQHCGGELKGFFSKKCVYCGKPKDY